MTTPNCDRGRFVAESAWPDVEQAIQAGAVALLPIGAASKAHGRHLPMNADWLQAEWLTRRLVEARPVLAWPTLGYGHYPAFTDYPGSVNLAAATFASLAAALLGEIRRNGVARCLVLNTGISTIAPLQAAIRRVAGFDALQLHNVYAGPRFHAVEAGSCRQRHGGHADEVETSLLLAIRPGAVDMARATPWDDRAPVGRFSRGDPAAPGYAPDGVCGDPTLASVAKGERLCAAMLADALAALDKMAATPRCPPPGPGAA